jgi:hypothetical protein
MGATDMFDLGGLVGAIHGHQRTFHGHQRT